MNDCLRGFTCELTGRHTCPLSNRNGMVAAVHVGVHGGRAHESAASLQWNLLSVHDFGNLEQCILPAGYPNDRWHSCETACTAHFHFCVLSNRICRTAAGGVLKLWTLSPHLPLNTPHLTYSTLVKDIIKSSISKNFQYTKQKAGTSYILALN